MTDPVVYPIDNGSFSRIVFPRVYDPKPDVVVICAKLAEREPGSAKVLSPWSNDWRRNLLVDAF